MTEEISEEGTPIVNGEQSTGERSDNPQVNGGAKDEGEKASFEQARLTAWLCIAVLSTLFVWLAVLCASAATMQRSGEDFHGLWQLTGNIIERTNELATGLAGVLILISLSVDGFTKLHKNERKLRIIFLILLGALVLALILWGQTNNPQEMAYHSLAFGFSDRVCEPQNGAQLLTSSDRDECIASAIRAFWMALAAWFGTSLATVLGLRVKVAELLGKLLGKSGGSK